MGKKEDDLFKRFYQLKKAGMKDSQIAKELNISKQYLVKVKKRGETNFFEKPKEEGFTKVVEQQVNLAKKKEFDFEKGMMELLEYAMKHRYSSDKDMIYMIQVVGNFFLENIKIKVLLEKNGIEIAKTQGGS